MPRKSRGGASAAVPPPSVVLVPAAASIASGASVSPDQMSTSGSTSGRDILFYGFSPFVREISASSRTAAHDLGSDLTTLPEFCESVPDGTAIIIDMLSSLATSVPGPEWKLLLEERFKTFLSAIEAVIGSTNSIPVRFCDLFVLYVLVFIRFFYQFLFRLILVCLCFTVLS